MTRVQKISATATGSATAPICCEAPSLFLGDAHEEHHERAEQRRESDADERGGHAAGTRSSDPRVGVGGPEQSPSSAALVSGGPQSMSGSGAARGEDGSKQHDRDERNGEYDGGVVAVDVHAPSVRAGWHEPCRVTAGTGGVQPLSGATDEQKAARMQSGDET